MLSPQLKTKLGKMKWHLRMIISLVSRCELTWYAWTKPLHIVMVTTQDLLLSEIEDQQ